ncbi:hypothetical protein L1049_015343 [Liquidambar formosana]|uniref:Uncharacterized protein n=1 Tax=Liquidambar formosana TaxID=63359 RepID=A0AAP0RXE5_LIQFO
MLNIDHGYWRSRRTGGVLPESYFGVCTSFPFISVESLTGPSGVLLLNSQASLATVELHYCKRTVKLLYEPWFEWSDLHRGTYHSFEYSYKGCFGFIISDGY